MITHLSFPPGRWRALAVLLVGSFMVLLDTSIVTNGLATIQRDLRASYAQVQFVLTAYALAFGMLLITGGRLGDRHGRKRVFVLGLAGFTATSALCGCAWSPLSLIVFRAFQGLSAAFLFPQVSSFIQVLFPLDERPRAFGIQGAIIGLGIVAGPVLGGVLIGLDLLGAQWRPIFLVNVPLGLLALVLAVRVVPESTAGQTRPLDVGGVVILSGALLLLLYPIIQGRDAGWPAWLVGMLAASLPVLWLFVAYQRRLVAGGHAPLVPLSLFHDRAFAVGALITLVFQSGVLSYFVAMSLFFQAGLGYTPIQAALLLIAYQITIAVGSLLSARLSARLGLRILTLGTTLLALGLVATLVILRVAALHYRGYELIPALLVGGFGFGCVVAPLQSLILARVPPTAAGSASGVLATIQQVGSAVGVALIGVLLFGQLAGGADAASGRVLPRLERSLAALALPLPAVHAITIGFQACVHDRFHQDDPYATPASCRSAPNRVPPTLAMPVGLAIAHAAIQARRENFLDAIEVTLRFQLAVYLLCVVLVGFLPRRPVGRRGEVTRSEGPISRSAAP
jgi:EmrB/QacA subfamily drug resistance transporter